MKYIGAVLRLFPCSFALFVPQPCVADDSGPYEFASAFIRTLSDLESVRDKGWREQKSRENPLEGCIRDMEAFQLELNGDISMLKGVRLTGRFSETPTTFANFFADERDQFKAMGDSCAKMLAADPKMDYGNLAAAAPKITARLEYLDESIFKVSPLVFATLIRPTPDAQNHMSHLSITRAQRDALARSIKDAFGKKLDAKNQNYTVSTASVLYSYLAKEGFKGSDEP